MSTNIKKYYQNLSITVFILNRFLLGTNLFEHFFALFNNDSFF